MCGVSVPTETRESIISPRFEVATGPGCRELCKSRKCFELLSHRSCLMSVLWCYQCDCFGAHNSESLLHKCVFLSPPPTGHVLLSFCSASLLHQTQSGQLIALQWLLGDQGRGRVLTSPLNLGMMQLNEESLSEHKTEVRSLAPNNEPISQHQGSTPEETESELNNKY